MPTPSRSIFQNFEAEVAPCTVPTDDPAVPTPASELPQPNRIDEALTRSFIYGFFARMFEDPNENAWGWLSSRGTAAALDSASNALSAHVDFRLTVHELITALDPGNLDDFCLDYVSAFGHAARGRCPMNEIEYGDAKADPLFQPHRLADLAAFYRAFGMELSSDAAERHDHLCIELEFMSVLAAKEAYAGAHADSAGAALSTGAQKQFLREHLGRWAIAFAARLAGEASSAPLAAAARALRAFIADECRRLRLTPGSDVLVLRPVNEADESLCASCGLQQLPPGAAPRIE